MKYQDQFERLKRLAHKVRCLGHLIETQDSDHVTPTDFDHVLYGLALFLNEINDEMIEISECNEEKE